MGLVLERNYRDALRLGVLEVIQVFGIAQPRLPEVFALEHIQQELARVMDGEGGGALDHCFSIAGEEVHVVVLGDDSVKRSLIARVVVALLFYYELVVCIGFLIRGLLVLEAQLVGGSLVGVFGIGQVYVQQVSHDFAGDVGFDAVDHGLEDDP